MAAREAYVNTSKAKAKADTMAANVSRQFGYAGAAVKPKAKPTATPTAKPKVTATAISKGEAAFLKELKNGKTFAQARKIILEKYGFSPNGMTN